MPVLKDALRYSREYLLGMETISVEVPWGGF